MLRSRQPVQIRHHGGFVCLLFCFLFCFGFLFFKKKKIKTEKDYEVSGSGESGVVGGGERVRLHMIEIYCMKLSRNKFKN